MDAGQSISAMNGLPKKIRAALRPFRTLYSRWNAELGIALVFLGLILVPSGLLGLLSWRALENEKLLSQERLKRSYGRIAALAVNQFQADLKDAEKRWLGTVRAFADPRAITDSMLARVDREIRRDGLIRQWYYLSGPDRIAHPRQAEIVEEQAGFGLPRSDQYLLDFELFNSLVDAGETAEYRDYDLDRALQIYRQIAAGVANRQLQGIARSYVGRVLMKQGNWQAAVDAFRQLREAHGDVRDLKGMFLSFYAGYQIAVGLESMGEDREAVDALLALYRELLDKSDEINPRQYADFLEQINSLLPRLLSSPKLTNTEYYEDSFRTLAEKNKKNISQKYFIALLNRKLVDAVLDDRRPRMRFRYSSGETGSAPFLIASVILPGSSGRRAGRAIGLELDLDALRQKLFPAILEHVNVGDDVALALMNERGELVLGGSQFPEAEPIAAQRLTTPFDFWRLAIFSKTGEHGGLANGFPSVIGLWLITLLLLSILLGAFIFVRRAFREAYLSKMKSTFVSNLSHELRTPLASIKMLSELLSMQTESQSGLETGKFKKRTAEYLSVINRESDRLSRLIDNLLDFSRIERGVKQYSFEYEDPAALVRLAVDTFKPQAEANGFSLTADIPENLPEVKADADAIEQVLLNLLTNAQKYSADVRDIRVRVYTNRDQVCFAVEDRGVGIAQRHQNRIFNKFYRIDDKLSAAAQGGVGIGLSVVRQIVHDHGGEISVVSEPGAGSVFTFWLPAVEDPATAGNSAESHEQDPADDRMLLGEKPGDSS